MSTIPLLSDSSVKWLRHQAQSLKKQKSISHAQALYEVALQQGFTSWKNLIDTFKYESSSRIKIRKLSGLEIVEEYTDEQQIGAIARNLGIDPSSIENSIYVHIEASEEIYDVDIDQWRACGFYEDLYFVSWLEKHDPYFRENGYGLIFRFIGMDTLSYQKVRNFIKVIGEKKLELMFTLHTAHIWINGKTDPSCLTFTDEDIEFYPNLTDEDGDFPLAEIPEEIWKRGY